MIACASYTVGVCIYMTRNPRFLPSLPVSFPLPLCLSVPQDGKTVKDLLHKMGQPDENGFQPDEKEIRKAKVLMQIMETGGERDRSGKLFADAARQMLSGLWGKVAKANDVCITEVCLVGWAVGCLLQIVNGYTIECLRVWTYPHVLVCHVFEAEKQCLVV